LGLLRCLCGLLRGRYGAISIDVTPPREDVPEKVPRGRAVGATFLVSLDEGGLVGCTRLWRYIRGNEQWHRELAEALDDGSDGPVARGFLWASDALDG